MDDVIRRVPVATHPKRLLPQRFAIASNKFFELVAAFHHYIYAAFRFSTAEEREQPVCALRLLWPGA
jgi:hypothetical protein